MFWQREFSGILRAGGGIFNFQNGNSGGPDPNKMYPRYQIVSIHVNMDQEHDLSKLIAMYNQ